MSRLTTYLYATPSFLEGVARLFDFSGSLNAYNCSKSPQQADFRAIGSDWMVVGGDLRVAIEHYREQEQILLNDSVVNKARNELMKDRTMQELVLSKAK